VKVADAGAVALGRHRGPRAVILKDAIVISAVVGEKADTGAHAHGLPDRGTLTVWRSTDRGATWTRASVINDAAGSAREGLHAMVEDSQGNLLAAWLDLRTGSTKLYGSRSSDGGRTWSRNTLIYASPDGTICECCAPTLAAAADRTWVMWRNVLNGSRDMYLAASRPGWWFAPGEKLGAGTWKVDACPMDGGGVAIHKGRAVTAWRRGGEVFLAEAGQPEIRVGRGKDVAVAAGVRGVYVAWSGDSGLEILPPGARVPRKLAADGAFVNLASLSDGSILAAWEGGGAIHTVRLEY
jgi:hypothetical protein